MAIRIDPSRPDSSPVYLEFTKQQVGLLIGGLLVLLALSFSLGFVVSERQGGADDAGAVASSKPPGAAVSAPGPREATVKFAPGGERSSENSDATKIQPSFYKALLEKEKPGDKKLDPLMLPSKPLPKSLPKDALKAEKKTAPVRTESVRTAPVSARLPKPEQRTDGPMARAASGNSGLAARFTIQVLSLKEPARAIRILRRLRDKGFSAFIQRVDLKDRGVWLRVRVGRYPDKTSALQALESLRAKASVKGGRIVPL
ncbi:MAG: SPOR domain-containing protein [bacterium]